MSMQVSYIIENEEKKCDPQILEKITDLISGNISIPDILKETGLSLYEFSSYIEVAFYKTNFDPSMYVDKEKVTNILGEFEKSSFPSLKEIKEKYPDCDYSEIRVVRGVYFRTKHYYQKKTKLDGKPKVDEQPTQMSLFDSNYNEQPQTREIGEFKVDITTVPFLVDCIDTFETEHWKNVAIELFSKYTPRQFYLLPASNSKKGHHETELSIGEFDLLDPKKISKMGGKYYHSYRVFQELLKILETDSVEIWDYKRVKVQKYVYGNEYEPWERDIMKLAALSHDIFSGGTGDIYNTKMKSMDKKHAHYHKTELLPLASMVSEYEWKMYIKIVDNHMWKWDPEPLSVKFHDGKNASTVEECYKFFSEYRLIKNIELCDYFATQRSHDILPKFKQAIETWFYIKKNIALTWDDLSNMGIPEEEIRNAFANKEDTLENFIKLALGKRYTEIKNISMM